MRGYRSTTAENVLHPHSYTGVYVCKLAYIYTHRNMYTHITGGRWHLNRKGRARGNAWSRISGMVSMPFHSVRSSHYYERSSRQQPPLTPPSPRLSLIHYSSVFADKWLPCSCMMLIQFHPLLPRLNTHTHTPSIPSKSTPIGEREGKGRAREAE